MHERTKIGIVLLSVVFMAQARPGMAQDERLQKIEQRLNALEERVANANGSSDFIKAYVPAAFGVLGVGLFCGLWARNSGRDFWLWFVAGLVFTVFALIAVLDAHERDKKARRDSARLASKESLDL
jgi:hypothetical protein